MIPIPWKIILAFLGRAWPFIVAACLVLGILFWVHSLGYQSGLKQRSKELGELVVKLEQVKSQRAAAISGNASLAASEALMRTMLAQCTAENARLADQGQQAIQQANAETRRAEQSLEAWRQQYQTTVSQPACASALESLQRACPVGEY